MVDSTTIIEVFKQQTTPSEEQTLDSVDVYKFGNRVGSDGFLNIKRKRQNQQIEDATKSYIQNVSGNYPIEDVSVHCYPTNGIWIYAVNGKATHTTADTKQTITSWDVGTRKPTYTIGKKIGSLNPFVVHGVLFTDLMMIYRPGEALHLTVNGPGRKNSIPAHTWNTPAMPTHASNSYPNDVFNVNNYVNWNAEACSNVDYVEIRQGHGIVPPNMADEGYYKNIDETKGILTTVTVQCHSNDGANDTIHTDYMAGTKRTMEIKFSKNASSTHYMTLTSGTNETLCIQNDDTWSVGNVVYWVNTFVMDDATWVVQDYLDDDFYTIPS